MKLDIAPFKVGDLEVNEVEVKHLNFISYVKTMTGAVSLKDQQRRRIKAGLLLNGAAPNEEQISLLPIHVAREVMRLLNDDEANGPRGEIIGEGDGISSPILYRLGTPLKMKRAKDTVLVEELEIHAKTFGEVEDIVAAQSRIEQAVEMLKRITTPVGVKGLTVLPEAMLSQITMTDGLLLALEVAPNFTD